ncbi:MAG: hypothetical protein IIB42_09400 [Candidatus Marinimicrobia bacterium]|nr:hypothetical protein [Candidatus Neomarinimicrobiota bacterium]
MSRLAKIGTLTCGATVDKPPHSATAVVEELELFIPLEGLIDIEVERERLAKRISEMQGRLEGIGKKLSNENFLRRAPAEVVSNEREKQVAYDDRLKKLQANHAALS